MKTIPIVRCWKVLDRRQYTTIVVMLEKFLNKLDFEINLCITHNMNDHWKLMIETYIENFNKKNNTNTTIHFYKMDELDEFLKNTYDITDETIYKLKNQPILYNVVFSFYMRKIKGLDYVLFHDDDILYTRQEIDDVIYYLTNELPFALQHPYPTSDFSLIGKLSLLLGKDVYTPYSNTGTGSTSTSYMGINLSVLDIFDNDQIKKLFTDVFSYDSFQDDGYSSVFKDGMYSFNLYTQEQSFFSLIGRARNSTFGIFNSNGYTMPLSEDEIKNNNPKIHHYIFDLKHCKYYDSFISYYNQLIVNNKLLFDE